MIIDFHTHMFPDKIAKGTIEFLQNICQIRPFTDGTYHGLLLISQWHFRQLRKYRRLNRSIGSQRSIWKDLLFLLEVFILQVLIIRNSCAKSNLWE